MKFSFESFAKATLFFLLPLVVLAWTSIPVLSSLTLHMALVLLLTVIGLQFIRKENLVLIKIALQVTTILFLVGATGWFFSPFFFLLYLVPLYLGFLYTPIVAFSFLTALLVIFSSSVGEVDIAYDIMTLVSLLLVIPLVIFLRRRYLSLRQASKDILILEKHGRHSGDSALEHVLQNRVNEIGTLLRQPVTYLKQGLMLFQEGKLTQEEMKDVNSRMFKAADELFTLIKEFERGATRHSLIAKSKPEKTIKQP